ncbi:MAG: acyl-CoA thioesterase [Minwuia sp.]|uniref:acyl-CoA thioesterase n=1 Tax=Minwuia sp. TaxID=2493630 RepID=UPI003A89F122
MAEQVYWRGTFNRWQLGLGAHINVQHYAQALDEARHAAALELGLGPLELAAKGLAIRPVRDRLDFRKELAPGDSAWLKGQLSGDGNGRAVLNGSGHLAPSETLTSRFETVFGPVRIDSREAVDWPAPPPGRPDPLRAMREIAEPLMPATPPANAWTTWQGTVEVRDCDITGLQSARGLFDIFTRGLWAVHIRLGRHRDHMAERGTAGGVTALQIRHGRPARMGDLLEIRTALLGVGSNSVRMGHLIRDVTDGAAVAQIEYVNTFIDRKTGRKTPPEPDYLEGLMDMRL